MADLSTKDFLKQVRKEMLEIKIKSDELEQVRMGLLPKALSYKSDKVQSSHNADVVGDGVAKTDSIEQSIKQSIEQLKERYADAYEMIESLNDSTQRQVMHLYFLSNNIYTINQIADMMGYTERQIYRIYGDAMRKLDDNNNRSASDSHSGIADMV